MSLMRNRGVILFILCYFSWANLLAQEICDNGVDDDNDGLIDLNDPDCNCLGILDVVTSLIPNPSFEDTICCPTSFTQLDCAFSWVQASNATSDYFNLCGYTDLGYPPPLPLPENGSGYAGFYNYEGYNYREMIGVCLNTPMEAGNAYRFNLFMAKGTPAAQPLVTTIYGTPNCADLPWEGVGCPLSTGSWVILGADTVEFADSSWHQVTIEFDVPEDIYALAIGGPCDTTGGFRINYYYIDELIVASVAEFDLNARITESGQWCTRDLQLHAAIDTAGGTWKWYRDGIALPGETVDSLNLMIYGTEEVYTAVYSLGGECVSVEHRVEVEFFQDMLPELTIRPSCKDFSNGQAYVVSTPEDTAAFSYQWYAANDTTILSETDSLLNVPPGDYRVQITVSAGCDTTLYFEIPEVNFRVSFFPSDTIVCVGDTIQFTNTSEAHFTAYHWALDNGDTLSGANLPPYTYAESGIYKILLTGTGEICADTAYHMIVVDAPVVPAFDFNSKEICVGQAVELTPYLNNTITQIQWKLGGDKRTEASVQGRYLHAFEDAGIFPVTLTVRPRACPDTSYTDSISVHPLPEVDLGADSSICLHGQSVYLKNLHDAPLNTYHQIWSTGDTTDVLKVVHPGIYTLSVSAEPIGCTSTESIEITKDCYIDIPNAFTPNGDGQNDYFLPRQLLTEGLNRFRMQVFNRWGQRMFETTNLNGRGWDGRFNDKVQPMGVYLYRIEATFSNGRQEQYEGNVTLIR